ncbi:MAG: SGNH/GDSL hydrolase family protein [Bacteroidales bacterium]
MENQNNSRRSFIKKAALGGLMAVSIPEILSAAMVSEGVKKNTLIKDNIILFQGDSITDSGRNKEDNSYNNARALGSGYPMLAGAALLEKYASLNLKVYNKGISGNKVYQLAERWNKDCLEIKPDILSILIGVNDIWHKLDGKYNGTIEIYKNDYIALLERTKKALPNVKLIICEPFAVKGVKAVDDKWYPEFYGYQKAAREIAAQFGATFVPYQKIYDEAQKQAPGAYWTGDGVHSTLAGAQLMAQAWLAAIK